MNEGHNHDNRNRTRYEDREASDDTLVSSTSTTIDGDKLQAAYDHSYEEYRKLIENKLTLQKLLKLKQHLTKLMTF